MKKTFVSDISGKSYPITDCVPVESVRESVFELIQKDHPDVTRAGYITLDELNHYRERYIAGYLNKQIGDTTDIDKKVLETLTGHGLITDKVRDDNTKPTLGDRVADKVAEFGGSWTFICIFFAFLFGWMAINVFLLANRAWDPYPFILLNLILSCLAAIQAPIIMMSQNRQADKDRDRATDDYMINLKSEIEVRALHEKLDHLMMYQQQELIEIQKIQIDMLTDILRRVEKREKASSAKK